MEPETNTPTPEITEKKKSNKPLYIIFGFLLAAIIALVIVIVVVNVNNNQVAKEEPAEQSDKNIIITNPEGLKRGEEFQAKMSATKDEAKKLLNEDSQNVDKVKELFSAVISEYSEPSMSGYAQTLINEEVELLLKYGLLEDAFGIYNLTDIYIPSDAIIQNELYAKALTLAKQNNNQEWVKIFQAKFDSTLAAKQAEIKATGDAKAKYAENVKK